MTDCASSGSADAAVVASHVAGDAADDGSADAAGVSRRGDG